MCVQVASIVSSTFYAMFFLFAGFIVPQSVSILCSLLCLLSYFVVVLFAAHPRLLLKQASP